MGRKQQAPYDFQCPYRDACPHLGGIPTTWAPEIISDVQKDTYRNCHFVGHAQEELAALQGDNQRLEKENTEMRARLQAQHASRFKPNRQPPPRFNPTPSTRSSQRASPRPPFL